MKLTSRALKVGDEIIRKAPTVSGSKSYTDWPLTIVKKNPYYTTVSAQNLTDTNRTIFILNHSTWNDNEWVRYK